MPASVAFKLALTVLLATAIFISLCARAPRYSAPRTELVRVVLGAVALYLAGALASRTHHDLVAALADAAGIVVCAVAVWLSRGSEPEDVSRSDQPSPDPEPGDFDWASFERGFRAYAARARTPVGRR